MNAQFLWKGIPAFHEPSYIKTSPISGAPDNLWDDLGENTQPGWLADRGDPLGIVYPIGKQTWSAGQSPGSMIFPSPIQFGNFPAMFDDTSSGAKIPAGYPPESIASSSLGTDSASSAMAQQ